MDERAQGIILRLRPLTESSLIVHWLTPDAGRVDTVARGARRPRSPFRGRLDLFFRAALSFQRSRRSELHTLREVALLETYPVLRTDWTRLRQAGYAAALIIQTTETDTPLPDAFELFAGLLQHLQQAPARTENLLAFELRHLAALGQQPDPAQIRPPSASRLAASLAEGAWEGIAALEPDPEASRALARFLHGFLIHHLDRIPPGRAAALV